MSATITIYEIQRCDAHGAWDWVHLGLRWEETHFTSRGAAEAALNAVPGCDRVWLRVVPLHEASVRRV